jgi:hypothetical protein
MNGQFPPMPLNCPLRNRRTMYGIKLSTSNSWPNQSRNYYPIWPPKAAPCHNIVRDVTMCGKLPHPPCHNIVHDVIEKGWIGLDWIGLDEIDPLFPVERAPQ